jgi:hypothetical protein
MHCIQCTGKVYSTLAVLPSLETTPYVYTVYLTILHQGRVSHTHTLTPFETVESMQCCHHDIHNQCTVGHENTWRHKPMQPD